MKEFDTIKMTGYYAEKIKQACNDVQNLLQEKNSKYGCSAFEDAELFGMVIPAQDGVIVRLNDKFKRMANEIRLNGHIQENDLIDAIGYMVLMLIQHREEKPSGQVINQ